MSDVGKILATIASGTVAITVGGITGAIWEDSIGSLDEKRQDARRESAILTAHAAETDRLQERIEALKTKVGRLQKRLSSAPGRVAARAPDPLPYLLWDVEPPTGNEAMPAPREVQLAVRFSLLVIDRIPEAFGKGEIWFEFSVNDQRVRWPRHGVKQLKAGAQAVLPISFDLTMTETDELRLSVEGWERDGGGAKQIDPMGFVRDVYTLEDGWGVADSIRTRPSQREPDDTGPQGRFRISYQVSRRPASPEAQADAVSP